MEGTPPPSSPAAPLAHGGNLTRATALFGAPANGWLDLSTGINPVPYADLSLSRAALTQLPSEGALAGLLDAARTAYGFADRAALCAAPGTQALIELLPTMRPTARVAVLSPTYGEHASVWRRAGHRVTETGEIGDLETTAEFDVVVVTNPNNPDGRICDPTRLMRLSDDLARTGGWLMVDEAFADVTPAVSLAPLAGRPGLVVLRSFGKFFGLAGARLGFAAGPADLIAALETRLGPWAVSGPALEIGTRALSDSAWIETMRTDLAGWRARLDSALQSAGFTVIGGTDLFRLTTHDDAPGFYRHLGHTGILVRDFPDHPAWLRFGLPGSNSDFLRLEAALR